jgi:dTDP-4-amino-4,6-dideoxygalactose transaminase
MDSDAVYSPSGMSDYLTMFRHQPPAARYLPLSNLWAGFGRSDQDLAQFQQALEQYLGVKACFLASSARTALFVLLKTLNAERPDRPLVLLPAYTCPVLVKVIMDVGLRPCPIDISPETFAFDMDHLAAYLDEQVLAVIHVHPFGIPHAIEEVMRLAHEVGAVVIEDSAQAMGATLDGQQVGTIGDFGLFSLGPGKPLSVAGGGVLCTNDEKWAEKLRAAWQALPETNLSASAWAFTRMVMVRLATEPHGWWLAARAGTQGWGQHPSSWMYKLRQLSPVQARIGRSLLDELDGVNEVRRENGGQLSARLQKFDYIHVPDGAAESEPIYLRLPIVVDSAERREQLFQEFWRAHIGAGRLYQNALKDIFPQLQGPPNPGAVEAAKRLLTLPTHHYLDQADIDRIVGVL